MNPLPTDPMRQHARFIEALCQDWLEAGTVTRDTPRADAVLSVRLLVRRLNEESRKDRKEGDQ
jgi:hypothetical protein